jgi:hypothetical protein
MEATFQVVPSFYGVHVILKTITRTRMLKGGGFGLTDPICYLIYPVLFIKDIEFFFCMPQQFGLIQELQLPFVHVTSTKHPHLHIIVGPKNMLMKYI